MSTYNAHEVDLIKEISDLQGVVKLHQKDIENLRIEVGELRQESKAIHEINENIARMLTGFNYMQTDIGVIKTTQDKITGEVSAIKTKVSEIENRPAEELRTRVFNIRDRVLIGAIGTAIAAVITAIIAFM